MVSDRAMVSSYAKKHDMTRNRSRAIVVVATVTALLLGSAVAATPAYAGDTTPPANQASALEQLGITVNANGWITYQKAVNQSLTLTNSSTTTVKGTVLGDGSCDISGKISSTSAQQIFVEEIAYNPLTCQERMVSGTLPAGGEALLDTALPAGVVAGPSIQATTQAAPTTRITSAAVAAAAVTYKSAHTKTLYIDPVNLTITSNTVNLKWPLNGAAGTVTSSSPTYKFPYDGWTTASQTNTGIVASSSGWYVQQNVHFINYDFAAVIYAILGLAGWVACGALPTTRADFHHQDRITGNKSGTDAYTWSDSVSGACSNLVHHASSNGTGFTS